MLESFLLITAWQGPSTEKYVDFCLEICLRISREESEPHLVRGLLPLAPSPRLPSIAMGFVKFASVLLTLEWGSAKDCLSFLQIPLTLISIWNIEGKGFFSSTNAREGGHWLRLFISRLITAGESKDWERSSWLETLTPRCLPLQSLRA